MNIAYHELMNDSGLMIDPNKDVNEVCAFILAGKKNGCVILGGGSPKNFYLQGQPTLWEVYGIPKGGNDYFIQITTDQVVWGGLSGATPAEAVSWGKVNPGVLPDTVVAYCDSTIAFPLFCEYAVGSTHGRRPRKELVHKRDALVAQLREEASNATRTHPKPHEKTETMPDLETITMRFKMQTTRFVPMIRIVECELCILNFEFSEHGNTGVRVRSARRSAHRTFSGVRGCECAGGPRGVHAGRPFTGTCSSSSSMTISAARVTMNITGSPASFGVRLSASIAITSTIENSRPLESGGVVILTAPEERGYITLLKRLDVEVFQPSLTACTLPFEGRKVHVHVDWPGDTIPTTP